MHAIMKTMCPISYHNNGFVTTHALGHMKSWPEWHLNHKN